MGSEYEIYVDDEIMGKYGYGSSETMEEAISIANRAKDEGYKLIMIEWRPQ